MGSSDYPMGEIISGENSREVDEVAARQCEHALLQNTMDKKLNATTVLTEFSDKNRFVQYPDWRKKVVFALYVGIFIKDIIFFPLKTCYFLINTTYFKECILYLKDETYSKGCV